ncbi:hypothetical protein X777_06981 [Ooceraea biroi]|uniref:Uncharacterized protein n=1 Tax=Ooceraea biroi TaxID=2015173 RepID=A0A026WBQ0_OOCBI|nr:hypothetical protein X777_06981 [Ooceraea biroi]
MEPEQRGRASRASSTSSLGREVRCGCQYYQSDSLLPERRALLVRPSSRTMQQPPAVRCSEHEYEPIAPPPHPMMAPVVRITDTDVMPVADSDDSLDDRGRLPLRLELVLDGDIVLPLDGKIEDSAMEGRELGETGGDTSGEELEPTAQELQDRLEERFLHAPTPYTESRTDGEVNTSQVDSSVMEELPLRRGARGLPQRLKNQAGKLRSRLRGIQRPAFSFPQKRQKPDKKKTTTTTTTTTRPTAASSGKSDKSRALEKRPSRIERIRTSISEKTGKFSLPLERPKFGLPDRSKFHLPERPKFSFPDKSRFHLPDRAKFNIKKPNIRLPSALARVKRPPTLREQQQRSTESTAGSRRNIFDFATIPRIFDRRSKNRGEYATSSPKDSRAQSTESATFPRARKERTLGTRWTQRFGNSAYVQDQDRPEDDAAGASDGSPPWHQSSTEEPPRLSARTEEEIMAAARAIPWEDTRKRAQYDEEEIQYMDCERESSEMSDRHPPRPRRSRFARRKEEEEPMEVNSRLYEQGAKRRGEVGEDGDWHMDEPIPRSRSLDEDVPRVPKQEEYEGTFMAVDPRRFVPRKAMSEGERELEEGEEEREPSSMQSDREQQESSGSSCDRRRRGVIEEIDSDEFFLRESGISQDDVNLADYLADEIRDALRPEVASALRDDELPPVPPRRPVRMRSLGKRKEDSAESNEVAPPARPKRERTAAARRSREASIADEVFRERTRSDSRHRVVYRTEGDQREPAQEPLDDIVVVKPARRKSRSSQPPMETSTTPAVAVPDSAPVSATPPVAPVRRKRPHRETIADGRNGDVAAPICNGYHEEATRPETPTRPSRSRQAEEDVIAPATQEDRETFDGRLQPMDFVPEPPRGTSVAADDDRTSRGAESLPEAGFFEEDVLRDECADSARDLSGYAIVEKPPRPPPPRRKRDEFATAPRPVPPKRPQRAYSTLGPIKTRSTPVESAPYIEVDADDVEHKELRGGKALNKIQGRPLPAPPRPPRARKERAIVQRPRTPHEFAEATEITTATQTDPLPDDVVIEQEEITQAKLIMTPSRSGSQVLVSMERIPSPSGTGTPPVPPLPMPQLLRKEEEEEELREDIRTAFDTVSLTSPSPIRETDPKNKHRSAPHLEERVSEEEPYPRPRTKPSLLPESLKVSSLEVGDLKVDRLSVSQIEAHRIMASEVDAMMITTSELKGGSSMESSFSPAIIRELMAIRSHLESVATSQAQERQRESERESESHETTDIPTTDDGQLQQEDLPEAAEPGDETVASTPVSTGGEKTEADEDQKVVKANVVDVEDKETSRTLPVAQTTESTPPQTLAIELGSEDEDTSTTSHLLTVTQDTEDKSLRILDPEHSLAPSPPGSHVEESRASYPTSDVPSTQPSESRVSPERLGEPPDSSIQTTTATTITTSEPTLTSTDLRGSKDDVSDSGGQTPRKSRSRSSSPSKSITRQTASPVRSLPPAISVTPDTPDTFVPGRGTPADAQPQRATISYSSHTGRSVMKDAKPQRAVISHISDADSSLTEEQRESSQSPAPSFPLSSTHFIAFPASEIPAEFFSPSETPTSQRTDSEPGVMDTTQQLLRALRLAGIKAMRHFVRYLTSTLSTEDTREKVREVELAICALLLLIAGLLIYYFGSTQTVTHYHHWDYFNPPQ